MTADSKKRLLIGIILIAFGVIFLGESMGKYSFDFIWFIGNFWPVLLIIAGMHMILLNSKLWWIIPALLIIFTIYFIYFLSQHGGSVGLPYRFFRYYQFKFR
ncbi:MULTISPECIES: LiaI-LiaF-like domain-containing protein [unclassified Halanaerobium]|uniref:LiaI-LiaF-like domain-containing protein n=1 Tax=unclassified Halanaerobium TaxID=2641197 RepID=UPI000DF438A8|nr:MULTISPECIES: DUF5668 domain-containing protein [unclassified Halanaerobium]RCW49959.1 hypothetical protein DFR78_104132 [Halanaerobium sp. MA284_MarDTE_T2]RCW81100.1 hypothetical protein DER71_12628 [Halanaerobium sp. DL-01]